MSRLGGSLTVRPMTAGDDLDAELDLSHRAFGPFDSKGRAARLAVAEAAVGESRLYGVWEGTDFVGSAGFYDMRQWWYGRALPMAGVYGVKVAPEARGRGVGKALMSALLDAVTTRGYPISALYPATAGIYRSLGWEMAGGLYLAEMPGRSLGSLLPADPEVPAQPDRAWQLQSGVAPAHPDVPLAEVGRAEVRRAGADDADEVITVLGAVHSRSRDSGPATFNRASVRSWLADPDMFGYLAQDGFLSYSWDGGNHQMIVHALLASSARTLRTLWGIVASHASVAEVVRANVGPHDPIGWLTSEPDVSVRRHETWMLRVLDAPAAVGGRGFPATIDASVQLLLADPDLPANAGPHTLTVSAGRGSLTPGITTPATASPAAPAVRLGPRGFAALFAGVPMATLRRAGLAAGGDARADEALDGIFAGTPYLLDYF